VSSCVNSAAELAQQLHVASNRIDQRISSKRVTTADTALRLEQLLGVEAAFRMNPQNSYELELTTEKYGEKI
jgi:addiction module HigA family antidote